MGVRNCGEIGENLQKIANRLMANDKLVNLLYYTDKDPLNQPYLTEEQKREQIFDKQIKVVPRIGPKEDAKSIIVIKVAGTSTIGQNSEFKQVKIQVEVFVPLTQWYIKDSNLRPFAILGEIQNSLDKKKINGLGEMIGGDFVLNFLTDEISSYESTFWITAYE